MPLRHDYAPWGRRVAALLIDQVPAYIGEVVLLVGYVQTILTIGRDGIRPPTGSALATMAVGVAILLAAFGWDIYNRWVVAGRTGQSLGKRLLKIRLVGEQTNAPIGPLNALARDLLHILDGYSYVGYLWPLWDERHQTLADKIAQTVVVIAPTTSPAAAATAIAAHGPGEHP